MSASRLIYFSISIASCFLLANCSSKSTSTCTLDGTGCDTQQGGAKDARSGSTGGTNATAGMVSTGGMVSSGGNTLTDARATGGSPSDSAASNRDGSGQGGTTFSGGSIAQGGQSGTGGITGSGGSIGGNTSSDGGHGTGGMTGTGGAPTADRDGIALAKPGDSKNQSRQYLNLGDMRLIVNKWGSDELHCNTSMRVFVDNNKSFGWTFDRGACGGSKEKPDYPEIEFGVHPFDSGSSLATTPSFSSTTLLPIQIKDLTSASVALDGLEIKIQKASTYNFNFELWLSQKNPTTEPSPGVHAELITFLGWQDAWACDKSGSVRAGDRSFKLCHQSDSWAGGKWRYFQFRLDSGSTNSFSGKIDIKALLDWLVSNHGYSKDLWITRFEIGSEIDDNTSGTVTLKNVTFEVNGVSKSPAFSEN
jgi:hypothetical protein